MKIKPSFSCSIDQLNTFIKSNNEGVELKTEQLPNRLHNAYLTTNGKYEGSGNTVKNLNGISANGTGKTPENAFKNLAEKLGEGIIVEKKLYF